MTQQPEQLIELFFTCEPRKPGLHLLEVTREQVNCCVVLHPTGEHQQFAAPLLSDTKKQNLLSRALVAFMMSSGTDAAISSRVLSQLMDRTMHRLITEGVEPDESTRIDHGDGTFSYSADASTVVHFPTNTTKH